MSEAKCNSPEWQQGFDRGAADRARVGIELSRYKRQLADAEKVIEHFLDCEDINADVFYKPAKEYFEKYKREK